MSRKKTNSDKKCMKDNSDKEYLKDDCPDKATCCINEPFHIKKSVDSFSILRPSSNPFIPPDPICATGPKVFVVMVNSTIGIYNKCTGSLLFQQGLSHGPSSVNPTTGFWDSVRSTTTVFDP